jgi:hypothetical protein
MLKNTENSQFARVSSTDGNREGPVTSVDPNDSTEPLADNNSRLIIRIALENGFVTELNPFPIVFSEPERLITGSIPVIPSEGVIVNADPLIIYSIIGTNYNILESYLLLFDATVLPTSGVTVPNYSFYLPSGPGSLPIELSQANIYPSEGFSNGLVLAYSTTPFIYTEQTAGQGFNYKLSYSQEVA